MDEKYNFFLHPMGEPVYSVRYGMGYIVKSNASVGSDYDPGSVTVEFSTGMCVLYTHLGELYYGARNIPGGNSIDLYPYPIKIVRAEEPKPLVFLNWLRGYNISPSLFVENCKLENQRFDSISDYYDSISQLADKNPKEWLRTAFNPYYSICMRYSDHKRLVALWDTEVMDAREDGRKVEFGNYMKYER